MFGALLLFTIICAIVVIACWSGRGSKGTGGAGWDNWGAGGGGDV
jgi:hypothetical protein